MICTITATPPMVHCTRCRRWLQGQEFEEHAFGHHVRGEHDYGIDQIAYGINALTETRGYDLWRMRLQVHEDQCKAMRQRIAARYHQGLLEISEQAKAKAQQMMADR